MLTSEELYEKAYGLHYKAKNFEEAYRTYKQILDMYPDSKEAGYAASQLQNLQVSAPIDCLHDVEVRKEIVTERQRREAEEQERIAAEELEKARLMELERRRQEELKHWQANTNITTGFNFEGFTILGYLGILQSEAVIGTGMLSEYVTSVTDGAGIFNPSFQKKIRKARTLALNNIKMDAIELGANAIIGVHYSYIVFKDNVIGVMIEGTAVKIAPNTE